jgi:hypothetical protein
MVRTERTYYVKQVKSYWYETEDSANQAYGSVKDWIFDS